ncbi:acetyltransferase [Weissella oryzae SG25]|uniref:Acetyltransferase n=1 Tax=Weissella oryzae (strain DSM 25784 / JCM 18191 / LMG 30913 / SG25) TaxID=1329250 RepID=A0A069D233_WEIOS|nr:GNAT family N-acetyltransferase [Weissella oryzae]GAK31446.1 acetyltransferase [Weissella oryzae SG25]
MEIEIRLAEDEDTVNLLILMQKLMDESDTFTLEQDLTSLQVEQTADNIERLNSTANNILLVAAGDNQELFGVISAAALPGHPRIAEVGMAVLKKVQGHGLAQALLAEVIDWANDYSSVDQLFLTVQSHNQRAIHIYEKMGFQKITDSNRTLVNSRGLEVRAFDMVLPIEELGV